MAEEDLKRAILARIQKEKEDCLSQARQEADAVLKQAKEEASSLREKNLSEVKGICFFKKTKELSEITSEAKRQLLDSKEKKILEVLSKAKEAIGQVRNDKGRYKNILKNLLLEAQDLFDKKIGFKVRVNPDDQKIASEILGELKLNACLETKDSIDAGFELCDLDENIIILNTLTSRLEKLLPQLRQEINNILFGN